jgi:hypothetical protein
MPTNCVWNIVYMLTITNILAAHNFEVMSDKSNIIQICSSGNYAQKWIYCSYNFLFIYRIEQPSISSTDRLFEALQTCPLIERVCVISSNKSELSKKVLVEFVSGAPKLVFLLLCLDTLTMAACKQISDEILERYVCKWELCIN